MTEHAHAAPHDDHDHVLGVGAHGAASTNWFIKYCWSTDHKVIAMQYMFTGMFLAMIGACTISGICGAMVPLTLRRWGADPATASSIFLTTATDIFSMGLLLGLATLLVWSF